MAYPPRLDPPKKIYTVWMKTDQNGIKEVGQSQTSSSFLSKTMKSSLKTSAPFQPIAFVITSEDDPYTHSPSGEVILRTN